MSDYVAECWNKVFHICSFLVITIFIRAEACRTTSQLSEWCQLGTVCSHCCNKWEQTVWIGWHLVVTGWDTGTWSSYTELLETERERERRTVRLLFALEQDQASSVLLLIVPPFRRQSQKGRGKVLTETWECIQISEDLLQMFHLDFELSGAF